jgi:hypothetical protein
MPTITMRDAPVTTLAYIRAFLQLDRSFQLSIENKQQRYEWIEEAVRKFGYHRLRKKKDRTLVRRYIRRITGLSISQLTHLITQYRKIGRLRLHYEQSKRNGFRTVYGPKDIALLIATDILHQHLNGKATKRILERDYTVFGRTEYEKISGISPAWIYHIRRYNRQYTSSPAKWIAHTRTARVDIGIRAKPRPEGNPGFLRIDTVHERSRSGLYDPDALRRPSPVTRSITRRAGVAEMVEAVPVVEQEALGRGAVVVEAEARVAQPMIRKGSLGQYRHRSCSP